MSATRIITNAWQVRTLPDIFYEEKERVEDGMLQELPIERVTHLLRQRYEDRPDVFISGEVFVSYDINNGNRRVGPDLFIAFDVNVSGIREGLPNYWIWEVGKAPDFVMEVASPSTAEHDLGWKAGAVPAFGGAGVLAARPHGGSAVRPGDSRGAAGGWGVSAVRGRSWSRGKGAGAQPVAGSGIYLGRGVRI